MKINNEMANPTVTFGRLQVGDVFMTLTGNVYIKLAATKNDNRWPQEAKNSFSVTSRLLEDTYRDEEVVPVEAELTLKKNSYEKYNNK